MIIAILIVLAFLYVFVGYRLCQFDDALSHRYHSFSKPYILLRIVLAPLYVSFALIRLLFYKLK